MKKLLLFFLLLFSYSLLWSQNSRSDIRTHIPQKDSYYLNNELVEWEYIYVTPDGSGDGSIYIKEGTYKPKYASTSTSSDVTVNIIAVNDVPIVTTSGGTAVFTEPNDGSAIPIVVDPMIMVVDLDNTTLSSAIASITGNFQADQDILAFVNDGVTMGNIIGSYNSGIGVLTLTSAGASATLAQWETALRAITYSNSSSNPNTANRTISFVVNDGTESSNSATKIVEVVAVNTAPVAVDDEVVVIKDTPATGNILTNDWDAEGDALTALLLVDPINGTMELYTDGRFRYTPNSNFVGIDSLSYQACDNGVPSRCSTAKVYFTVEALPPVIGPDADNILYVNKNVTGGDGSGDSWINAIPELADALKWAQEKKEDGLWDADNPLKIYVAKGTYLPKYSPEDGISDSANPVDNRDKTFLMVSNVQLYGGFDPANGIAELSHDRIIPSVDGTPTDGTILSGDFNNDDFIGAIPDDGAASITSNAENTYHVVVAVDTVEAEVILNGFSLTGGNANGSNHLEVNGKIISRVHGGGIYSESYSVLLVNSAVYNNVAKSNGGGISSSSSRPRSIGLDNSILQNNSASGNGGGIYTSNTSLSLNNSILKNNIANINGGGIYASSASNNAVTVIRSTMESNKALKGGGIYSHSLSFSSSASSSVSLINSAMLGNRATEEGSGIYLYSLLSTSTMSMINSIITENKGKQPFYFEGIRKNIFNSYNSIVYGNYGDDFTLFGGLIPTSDIQYSLLQELSSTDNGNLDGATDPMFVDPSNGDYRLKEISPLIHRGSNALYEQEIEDAEGNVIFKGNFDIDKDLAGNSRLQGGRIDIGPYESPYEDIVSLSALDAISVDYGTQLADIVLPTDLTITATLANGDEVPIDLDTDTENWDLVSASIAGLINYNPHVVGTYTFEAPVLLPDPAETPWFTNSQGLKATLEIRVEKGDPSLTASWDGTDIDPADGLELVYGDVGALVISHSNTDSDVEPGFSLRSGDGVLNLADLSAVQAILSGTGRLAIILPETDNFNEVIFEFEVRVAKKDLNYDDGVLTKSKDYDGTLEATLTGGTLMGVEAGDDVALEITALYDDKNAGKDKTITVSYVLTGTAADNYHAPLEEVYSDAEIKKAVLQVTALDTRKVYGEEDPVFEVEYSGFISGEDENELTGSIAYDRAAGEDVGQYSITPSGLTNVNYDVDYLDGKLSIEQLPVTITAGSKMKVYGEADPVLTFVSTPAVGSVLANGEVVSFRGALGRAVGEDVGRYAIEQNDLGNGNYQITYLGEELEITRAPLLITANNATKVYDGQAYSGGNDVRFDGFVNGEQVSVLGGTLSYGGTSQGAVDVGTYTILPSGYTSYNYEISFEAGTLNISLSAANILTFSERTVDETVSRTYGSPLINASAVASSGLRVTYESDNTAVATVNEQGEVEVTGVGTATITVTQGGNHNYEAAEAIAFTLQVDKAPLTVKAYDATKVYDGTAYSGGNGVRYSGFVNGEDATVIKGIPVYGGNSQGAVDAGTYAIEVSGLSANNYGLNYEEGVLEIVSSGDNVLTFAGQTAGSTVDLVYGAGILDASASATSGLAVSYLSSDAQVARVNSQGQVEIVGAGKATITAQQPGDTNFGAAADISITLSIVRKPLSITAYNHSKMYDGTAYQGGNGVSYSGFVYDEDESVLGGRLVYSGTAQGATDVGGYFIEPTGLTSDNYAIRYHSGSLTITKAELTVMVDAEQSKIYGDADPVFTYAVTGFQATDDESILTGELDRVEGEDVGSYAITKGTLSAGDNYDITFVGADFEIGKAVITGITLDDATFTYDGTDKSLAITGVLPEGTIVSYTNNEQLDAGVYTVTASIAGGNNYEDLSLTAVLRIEKADFDTDDISFSDATFIYDGEEHTIYVLGVPMGAYVDYTNNVQTEVGVYTVEALVRQQNYNDLRLRANLRIKQARITGVSLGDASFVYDGTAKSLAIAGTLPAGTSVTYTNNKHVDAGDYRVVAEIDGGLNFENLTLSALLTIEKATSVLQFAEIPAVGRDAGTLQLDIQSNNPMPILLYIDNELVAVVTDDLEVEIRGVGVTTILAEQDGDANHHAAAPVSRELRVLHDADAKLPVRVHPALSPNGDGVNDFLRVEGIEEYPDNMLRLFNSNGQVFYEGRGYNNGSVRFEGRTSGGQLPEGTYYYVLEIKVDGKYIYDKGFFVIRY